MRSGAVPAAIDAAEDRQQWSAVCEELGIPQPPGGTARSRAEALAIVGTIGYPALLRPSYVLGGRAMEIVYDDAGLSSAFDALSLSAEETQALLRDVPARQSCSVGHGGRF